LTYLHQLPGHPLGLRLLRCGSVRRRDHRRQRTGGAVAARRGGPAATRACRSLRRRGRAADSCGGSGGWFVRSSIRSGQRLLNLLGFVLGQGTKQARKLSKEGVVTKVPTNRLHLVTISVLLITLRLGCLFLDHLRSVAAT
jgi:hypothetical protein